MATFTWDYYGATGPAWTDISTNTLVFSGTGGKDTPITVGSYNDETHITNSDPPTGTDQCGANHVQNCKYISDSNIDIGGGSVAISDANVAQTDCTLRVHFNHTSSVAISSARLYAYNGTTETTEASGVKAYAFERGVSATAWTKINEGATTYGGDNSGERLNLGDKTAATDHYWYVAVSVSPESVGAKTAFDLGVALTYS